MCRCAWRNITTSRDRLRRLVAIHEPGQTGIEARPRARGSSVAALIDRAGLLQPDLPVHRRRSAATPALPRLPLDTSLSGSRPMDGIGRRPRHGRRTEAASAAARTRTRGILGQRRNRISAGAVRAPLQRRPEQIEPIRRERRETDGVVSPEAPALGARDRAPGSSPSWAGP